MRAAEDAHVRDRGFAAFRVRSLMIELEETALRAAIAILADVRAAELIARDDFALYSRRDMARGVVRSRGRRCHRCLRLFGGGEFLSHQRFEEGVEGVLEDFLEIAVGDAIAKERFCGVELVSDRAGYRELKLEAIFCERSNDGRRLRLCARWRRGCGPQRGRGRLQLRLLERRRERRCRGRQL